MAAPVALASTSGRWLIAATVLGSGIAFLDGTVVNVALPTIGRELGGGLPVACRCSSGCWTVTCSPSAPCCS
jgi:hypothetical protein